MDTLFPHPALFADEIFFLPQTLFERIAADERIPLTSDDFTTIHTGQFIGRASEQVSEFLASQIQPLAFDKKRAAVQLEQSLV